jgi:hypothetical protein
VFLLARGLVASTDHLASWKLLLNRAGRRKDSGIGTPLNLRPGSCHLSWISHFVILASIAFSDIWCRRLGGDMHQGLQGAVEWNQ